MNTHTFLTGELIEYDNADDDGLPYYKHLNIAKLKNELARLDTLFRQDHSLETLSDYVLSWFTLADTKKRSNCKVVLNNEKQE